MRTNISNKGVESTLTLNVDFNQILNDNFAEICKAIAIKGLFLKEMTAILKDKPNAVEVIIKTVTNAEGSKEAEKNLCEQFGMSQITAQYILNTPISELISLTERSLDRAMAQYKEIVEVIR